MKKIFILIVKFYRKFLSPLKKPCCRFYPSCSEYSLQAFEKYGAFKGLRLSFKRIMKCHPFGSSGYDPLK